MSYDAFVVNAVDRHALSLQFPPKFSSWVGDHVTHVFGTSPTGDHYGTEKVVHLVGHMCNPAGLEAFVVSVDGGTTRPDGKTYHLTWSLDRDAGFRPVNSNTLVTTGQVVPINPPIPIRTVFQHI
jgi:hypothetical protein